MKVLDKKEATKKLKMDTTLAMSVCSSCSCGCSSGDMLAEVQLVKDVLTRAKI